MEYNYNYTAQVQMIERIRLQASPYLKPLQVQIAGAKYGMDRQSEGEIPLTGPVKNSSY
jgi:hypothetical protein